MLVLFACLFASAFAAPTFYDQRQDGEQNIRTDFDNIIFLVAVPKKLAIPLDILDYLRTNKQTDFEDRADVQAMEAFVEPSTPYRVEIGTNTRSVDGDVRDSEVVIPGRKQNNDPESQVDQDEMKLLGATEQCGPEGERDPVTLVCRLRSQALSSSKDDSLTKDSIENESQPIPEVVSS